MNKELAKSIGVAARQARKLLQLTQQDAAERIEVSVEFYARIERGISLPSILTFARLVSVLGVSADALLGKAPVVVQPASASTPAATEESLEIRRTMRRVRRARPRTLRLVNLLLRELEEGPLTIEAQDLGERDEQDANYLDTGTEREQDAARTDVVSATQMLVQEPIVGLLLAANERRPATTESFLAAAAE